MHEGNPLVEVFGWPIDNFSEPARRHRKEALCPFNNKSPNCTKDKKSDPLGACNVRRRQSAVITCPVRFQEDWIIAKHAASFFFEPGDRFRVLREVRLKDEEGKVAGNIDLVLAKYDSSGDIVDFGSVEVQAVYISGNMRNPFEHYMNDPADRVGFDWRSELESSGNYPTPDWRSSHKRLFQQLLLKGGIFNGWGKKQAVVIQSSFYESLPDFTEVDESDADMVWLIYDLAKDAGTSRYHLQLEQSIYTDFDQTLDEVGYIGSADEDEFVAALGRKLKREPNTPDLEIDN